jgi:hypothetical protein
MKESSKKNKHMTLDDRIEIQECLGKGMTFKAIARRIGKSQTTVSREIKLHVKPYTNGFTKTDGVCPQLLKAPYLCNGCEKKGRSSCSYRRQVYSAKNAQAEYEELLKESRSGIPLNKQDFYDTERIISDAVRRGQHVYHAIQANNLPVSMATVYRHIHKRYYSIGAIDLPRAVKFKPRKSNLTETIPFQAKRGRSYSDYLDFIEINSTLPLAQLDTVIGRIGGKVIMTLHLVAQDFMFGLLLDNKTAAEAAEKIQRLKAHLLFSQFRFGDSIPLILTDNGGEFSHDCFSVNLALHRKSRISRKITPCFEILLQAVLPLIPFPKIRSILFFPTSTVLSVKNSMERVPTRCSLLCFPRNWLTPLESPKSLLTKSFNRLYY